MAGALRRVLGLVDRIVSVLGRSADLLDDVHADLATATAGTAQPEVEQVVGTFAGASRDNVDLVAHCVRLRATIEAILARIVGLAGEMVPLPLPEDRVQAARRDLRPGVPRAQAAGWWLHSDGSRTRVLSGEDDDPDSPQKQAERFLKRAFPGEGRGLLVLARHVEIKIAMRMMGKPPTDEVVVMDRVVCGRDQDTARLDYTCDKVLPAVLEEGAKLIVIEPDGTRVVYRGRRSR